MRNLDTNIIIKSIQDTDLARCAEIHALAFPRQLLSLEWLTCAYHSYPKTLLFAAEASGTILGYTQWAQKSGFRKEVVLELEQIAVDPDSQSQGIGTALIEKSIPLVENILAERDAVIKYFMVSTRTDNQAQGLYRKTLNVEPAAVISNLYSADEVIMIAPANYRGF